MAKSTILGRVFALFATVVGAAPLETVEGFPEILTAASLRLGSQTIRLHGIATAPFGSAVEIEARGWLHRRIVSRRIYCHFNPTLEQSEDAPFGICEIEGLDLSALLVEAGMAVDCPARSKGRYRIQQQRAEAAGFKMRERVPLPPVCVSTAKKAAKKG